MSGRQFSPEFLARMGNGPSVPRDKHGRMSRSRSAKAERWARHVLFEKESPKDPEYVRTLRLRIINGMAGPQEIHLLRMIFGDPPKADIGRNEDAKHFEDVRRELFEFLRSAPQEARELSARLTRPRLLIGPRPPEGAAEPGDPPEPDDAG